MQCVVSLVFAGTSGIKRWHCRLKITKPVRNSSTILQCANGLLFEKKSLILGGSRTPLHSYFRGCLKSWHAHTKTCLTSVLTFLPPKRKRAAAAFAFRKVASSACTVTSTLKRTFETIEHEVCCWGEGKTWSLDANDGGCWQMLFDGNDFKRVFGQVKIIPLNGHQGDQVCTHEGHHQAQCRVGLKHQLRCRQAMLGKEVDQVVFCVKAHRSAGPLCVL